MRKPHDAVIIGLSSCRLQGVFVRLFGKL